MCDPSCAGSRVGHGVQDLGGCFKFGIMFLCVVCCRCDLLSNCAYSLVFFPLSKVSDEAGARPLNHSHSYAVGSLQLSFRRGSGVWIQRLYHVSSLLLGKVRNEAARGRLRHSLSPLLVSLEVREF